MLSEKDSSSSFAVGQRVPKLIVSEIKKAKPEVNQHDKRNNHADYDQEIPQVGLFWANCLGGV